MVHLEDAAITLLAMMGAVRLPHVTPLAISPLPVPFHFPLPNRRACCFFVTFPFRCVGYAAGVGATCQGEAEEQEAVAYAEEEGLHDAIEEGPLDGAGEPRP